MKLRELIAGAALLLFAACGTTYEATDTNSVAPASVRASFSTQYPEATNVVWANYDATMAVPLEWDLTGWPMLESDDYVVQFNLDNENYYAWYDSDGNWIGSAYVVRDHSTLPTSITNTINAQFPGYTITEVTREFENGRMAYEVELKSSTQKVEVLMDSNGNILKQKTKAND